MKVYLTKANVMKILCDHFHIPYVEVDERRGASKVVTKRDEVYWEGNPEKEEK